MERTVSSWNWAVGEEEEGEPKGVQLTYHPYHGHLGSMYVVLFRLLATVGRSVNVVSIIEQWPSNKVSLDGTIKDKFDT
jgi:hypothetical protein